MTSIQGNLVQLATLKVEDYELFHKWLLDKEVVKYSLSKWQKRHSKSQIKQWLEDTVKDRNAINFGIKELSTENLIGYAGISRVNKISRQGEYFIFIGDKNAWGKGYGTEVTKLVVEYGFKKLKLHRISLTVSEPNSGGVKAYTRAGFKTEGVMRDASIRDGKYHNKIIMAILESDWDFNAE